MPTAPPIAKAATTNASQPKIAVFRCFALQRPIRAAMLVLRFKGDMRCLLQGGCCPSEARTAQRALRCGPHASWGGANRTTKTGVRSSMFQEHGRPDPGLLLVARRL